MLEYDIEERAKTLATYIIETKSTVRAAAKMFNISKSTVHKDIAERLEKVNPSLANEAKKILEINKNERHIRGGLATKMKYSHDKIG
ncbi:MAG: sporulation transcriptional regulator SpoIIID [Clostridia bacterium]|nr:sporulation transcriptional regulator SpoIIID [Clostridia bacterium]